MALKLWEANCGDMCGFVIWSHDKQEVVLHYVMHVKGVHNLPMTEKEAAKNVKHASEAKSI